MADATLALIQIHFFKVRSCHINLTQFLFYLTEVAEGDGEIAPGLGIRLDDPLHPILGSQEARATALSRGGPGPTSRRPSAGTEGIIRNLPEEQGLRFFRPGDCLLRCSSRRVGRRPG
ncbi:hypothetical protein [Phaeovulum sp. NW3]|uniref:hypothetical protein n=1 Tax=Phaeovulum sp. NW3 TaxID=2934933 RepID=UPI002021363E|nr:hypothetical protein [Phaeovulum sp. NW3]MCL7466383.1 hypothetical protein [Phaeovulum sp. NW3]